MIDETRDGCSGDWDVPRQRGSRRSLGSACSIRRESHAVLVKLLEAREPVAVQVAAVRALAESDSVEVARILLPRLRGFEPSVRTAAIQTLLTRADWTRALLEAVSRNERGERSGAGLDRARRSPAALEAPGRLRSHRLAQKLFGQARGAIPAHR